jgi:hypothetical protein
LIRIFVRDCREIRNNRGDKVAISGLASTAIAKQSTTDARIIHKTTIKHSGIRACGDVCLRPNGGGQISPEYLPFRPTSAQLRRHNWPLTARNKAAQTAGCEERNYENQPPLVDLGFERSTKSRAQDALGTRIAPS